MNLQPSSPQRIHSSSLRLLLAATAAASVLWLASLPAAAPVKFPPVFSPRSPAAVAITARPEFQSLPEAPETARTPAPRPSATSVPAQARPLPQPAATPPANP